MGVGMKFLIVSDIHGATTMIDALGEEFAKVDAVLVAGDFAQFKDIPSGIPTLKHLLNKHERLFCVAGNCDDPSFVETLDEHDVCVQNAVVFSDGLIFAGSGGALRFTGVTPFERDDEELIGDLKMAVELEYKNNLVLLIHQPPLDTKLDVITAGAHVGSPMVREFIEQNEPLLVVSGHIHESFAIDTLGKTVLINPGSLEEGRYATVEVVKENGNWVVQNAELKQL